jgi:hypothetical protein
MRSKGGESTVEKFAMMPKYQGCLSSSAWSIIEIWLHSIPLFQVHRWSHFHRLFKIAPIAAMDILGLDPYQSQTQYLQAKFGVITKWKQSGNAVAAPWLLSCRFVASSSHFEKTSGNKEATLLLLCCQYHNTYLQRGHKLTCTGNHTSLS